MSYERTLGFYQNIYSLIMSTWFWYKYITPIPSLETQKHCNHYFLHDVSWCYFAVADTDECMDRVSNISGSMTCHEFLTHYGFQYCAYKYMQRNCCASQRAVCVPAAKQKWTSSFSYQWTPLVVTIIGNMS